MQSVIMHPGGSAGRPKEKILKVMIPRGQSQLAAPSGSKSVDAYYERLLECCEEFPATRAAVSELFHALAFGYLQQYPSRTYTLNGLGANFPNTWPSRTAAHMHFVRRAAERPGWPDFVIEPSSNARLRRRYSTGRGSSAPRRLILAAGKDATRTARRPRLIQLLPALRRFEHPVHDYWSIREEGQHPPAPGPASDSSAGLRGRAASRAISLSICLARWPGPRRLPRRGDPAGGRNPRLRSLIYRPGSPNGRGWVFSSGWSLIRANAPTVPAAYPASGRDSLVSALDVISRFSSSSLNSDSLKPAWTSNVARGL